MEQIQEIVGSDFECTCYSCDIFFWADKEWDFKINPIIDKRLFPSKIKTSPLKKPLIEFKTRRPLTLDETCIEELGQGAFGRVELCTIRTLLGTKMEIAVKIVNLSKKAESVGMTQADGNFSFSGLSFISKVETDTQLAEEEENLVMLKNEKNVGFSADERFVVKLFCCYKEGRGIYKFLFEVMNLGSLKVYMDQKGILSAVELKDFVVGLGRALSYLHFDMSKGRYSNAI